MESDYRVAQVVGVLVLVMLLLILMDVLEEVAMEDKEVEVVNHMEEKVVLNVETAIILCSWVVVVVV